jgi:hypothetical protein
MGGGTSKQATLPEVTFVSGEVDHGDVQTQNGADSRFEPGGSPGPALAARSRSGRSPLRSRSSRRSSSPAKEGSPPPSPHRSPSGGDSGSELASANGNGFFRSLSGKGSRSSRAATEDLGRVRGRVEASVSEMRALQRTTAEQLRSTQAALTAYGKQARAVTGDVNYSSACLIKMGLAVVCPSSPHPPPPGRHTPSASSWAGALLSALLIGWLAPCADEDDENSGELGDAAAAGDRGFGHRAGAGGGGAERGGTAGGRVPRSGRGAAGGAGAAGERRRGADRGGGGGARGGGGGRGVQRGGGGRAREGGGASGARAVRVVWGLQRVCT